MASIENRSHFQVTVKNRDDLTKSFAHNSRDKAEHYCQSLEAQKLKPKLSRLNNHYIIRIRKKGVSEQVLYANTLKEAELVKSKLLVEHSQGLFIDYAKAQNTTLAALMKRYLWEESPRNKSFEVEAYKINAMLEDAGLPRQSIAEIVASHPNPSDKVKNMKIRTETGKQVRAGACSATRFILKPFAQIVPEDITEYVDERCQVVAGSTVDRELDIISAVCNTAINKWRIHVLKSPMDGVSRPEYFNERDRRLRNDEEDRLLDAAVEEDEKNSQTCRLDQLIAPDLAKGDEKPTRYRIWQTRREHRTEAQETWVHVPLFETFIQFQLMTGARRGETLSLLWSDVDLEMQTAFLPETKNGRPRKLPLRSALVALLRQLPRTSERVFDLSHETLRKAWKRICERAGFIGENDLHVHDLRHEAISRVAEIGSNTPGGFSLIDLQAFSGHRDVRMLLRYAHLCAQSLAKRLDAAFGSVDLSHTHRGRKRLKKEAQITISDIIDDAPAVSQPTAPTSNSSVEPHPTANPSRFPGHAATTQSPEPQQLAPAGANVIAVDFKRRAA